VSTRKSFINRRGKPWKGHEEKGDSEMLLKFLMREDLVESGNGIVLFRVLNKRRRKWYCIA